MQLVFWFLFAGVLLYAVGFLVSLTGVLLLLVSSLAGQPKTRLVIPDLIGIHQAEKTTVRSENPEGRTNQKLDTTAS
jgi:hypothetical protein